MSVIGSMFTTPNLLPKESKVRWKRSLCVYVECGGFLSIVIIINLRHIQCCINLYMGPYFVLHHQMVGVENGTR